MSGKFEETLNDYNVECPYCGDAYQAEAEDYSEDEREQECDECGKKYFLHQNFTVTHHARPDCELNGEHHDYQPTNMRGGRSHPFCTVCSKCQPHGDLEKAI